MRVGDVMRVNQIYQSTEVKKVEQKTKGKVNDTLELSQVAKDFQLVKKALTEVPDVRNDKVDSIRQKLASGTYNVGAEEVAEKLADKLLDISI